MVQWNVFTASMIQMYVRYEALKVVLCNKNWVSRYLRTVIRNDTIYNDTVITNICYLLGSSTMLEPGYIYTKMTVMTRPFKIHPEC